jgi:para-nitrobenzyl esterase
MARLGKSKLSDKMVQYWTSMSQAGNREAEWPRYNPTEDNVLALTLPAPRVVSGRFHKVHKCDFWDELGIY